MENEIINVLFIADIIGKPGLKIVENTLPELRQLYDIDICIANGENGAAGKGLTQEIAAKYFQSGIDVITGGNHIFENFGYQKLLENNPKIIRPANYPRGVYGKGSIVVATEKNDKIGVINLQGRTFMYPIDCPFQTGMREVQRIKSATNCIIVDFHAEATAEKMALGWHLDGKVSAVIGTHTHVQTADERILPNGTAYITDAGMTGPFDSVIGMKREIAIKRFMFQTPFRYQPASENLKFNGVLLKLNKNTGRAVEIKRLHFATDSEGRKSQNERRNY